MKPHVSVSQLRLASESWDLFRESLAPNAWVKPGGFRRGEFPGALFHDRIAAPFMRALHMGADADLAGRLVRHHGTLDAMAESLHAAVYARCLVPAVDAADGLDADQMLGLAGAALQLAQALAAAFDGFPRPASTSDVAAWVLPPEQPFETCVELPGGPPLSVAGRLDAALFDPGRARARVIEFKCKDTESVTADLLQIALYGWLVHRATGMDVDGMLLYLGSDSRVIEYTARQLIEVACSANAREFLTRARDEWIACHAPAAEDPTGRLVEALAKLKCKVSGMPPVVGPRVVRCRVVPDFAARTDVKKLAAQAKNLQVALELESPPVIESGEGYVSIDIPRKVAAKLPLADVLARGARTRPASPVAFPAGVGIDGEVFWADMASPTMTSVLVGGTAGSGKSEFLKSAVVAMALGAAPAELKLTLIDPKRVTFTSLRELPHLDGPLLFDASEALEKLDALVVEMERRYRLFADAGVSDIEEFKRGGRPLPHHVVLIDEYADLMSTRKQTLEVAVQRLGQKGRAAGLHLMLATQRPDAKVVSPLVKANLQLKIALKVSTATNSQVILDQSGAQNLLGRGDLFVGGAVPVRRLQSPLASDDDVRRALAHS